MMRSMRLPQLTWLASVRMGPATRVAFGLVALMVTVLMLADAFVPGFLRDRQQEALRERNLQAQLLAAEVVQGLQMVREEQLSTVQAAMRRALQRDPALRAIAFGTGDVPLIRVGDPTAQWTLAADQPSTAEQVRSQLLENGYPWGELRMVFEPVYPSTVTGWLRHPAVRGAALVILLGLLGFQLYVRRAMSYLDPRSAVPERVRSAFDTLTEGVLVLDQQSRIMLVNQAFRDLVGAVQGEWIGRSVEDIEALMHAVQAARRDPVPWKFVMDNNQPMLGTELRLVGAEGQPREVVMHGSPILDGKGPARGCLLTFSDVTELKDRTQNLRVALEALSASKAELELRNADLLRLATRDSLTGCLNRRAFMEEADKRFAEARRQNSPLACIMCDIDHFKSVNDRFGHAAGDQVIQGAAKALESTVRLGAIVGRYGGEEYCVMISGVTLQQCLDIAERIRAEIEATLGGAMREHPGVRVTMSFGVAPLEPDTPDPAALIDFADQALYHSKQSGRNRVTAWPTLRALRDESLSD